MHPSIHARSTPDAVACVMADGSRTLTYRELDEQSNQFAQLLRARGVQNGDHVSLLMENRLDFFVVCWGAQRAGIIFTAISTRLRAAEVAYILENSGARLLVTSRAFAPLVNEVASELGERMPPGLMLDGTAPGFDELGAALSGQPRTPVPDEKRGGDMLYSSGTTGRPKGVFVPPDGDDIAGADALTGVAANYFGMDARTVYLSPAPLYHAAPMRFCMTVARLGGTVVVMDHFDAEGFMAATQAWQATHTQLVPTMFIRMLKLDPAVRQRHDMSSLTFAVHAAAPCPVAVKEQMIAWWGPIIWEYYAGTEGNGMTLINAEQWLQHKGSVGRAVVGVAHICDEGGNELPAGKVGGIYFGEGKPFEYYDDPGKTAASHLANGWSTLGDIGYLDEEGFLYLTDRKSYMIISGGVNIYPQEIEDLLVMHPKVADVAVFGIPNDEYGEEVKAVVQPASPDDATDATRQALMDYCHDHLSTIKCPRSIDFMDQLPRHATGKLYKRLLRDPYWQDHRARQGA